MTDLTRIGIITLIIIVTIIIYIICNVYHDNKCINKFNNYLNNYFNADDQKEFYILFFSFNGKINYKKFDSFSNFKSFYDVSEKYIKNIELIKINSYDYIQME